MDDLDKTLAHIGVKGMKWGVRRNHATTGGSSVGTGNSDGEVPKASEDAAKVAEAQKRAKSGGTKVLTTKELQDMVLRMNLDQQYSTILAKQPSKFEQGHAAVKKVIGVAKTAQEAYGIINSPMVKDLTKLMKQAAKAKAQAS